MRKIILFLLVSLLSIWITFWYTPTKTDQKLLDNIYEEVDKIYKTSPKKIEKLRYRIQKVRIIYQKNDRVFYVLTKLNNHLKLLLKNWIEESKKEEKKEVIKIITKKKEEETIGEFDYTYEVWPNRKYTDLSKVPWEDIKPWTLVLIYAKDTPYKAKFVVNVAATEEKPVVIRWIEDSNWELPKINWKDAKTREKLDYWNEERSIIKIGGSSYPREENPSWIYIENLDISGWVEWDSFYDDRWNRRNYISSTAWVHVEYGENIFIKNCIIHDNNNGIFTTHYTKDITISWNHIYGNWKKADYYTHNVYTESQGIIYEYNRFGPLRDWAEWNNLKDRSAWTIIRYNWIEGWNRQLDLVDTSHDELYRLRSYKKTYVYWNILIEPENEWNSQLIHYWGDSSKTSKYREGTIYIYNNTIVSTKDGKTTLIRLSTNKAEAEIYNNIIYSKERNKSFAITAWKWQVILKNNLLPNLWTETHENYFGWNITKQNNISSNDPWFENLHTDNFNLDTDSEAIWKAKDLSNLMPVKYEYFKHQDGVSRKWDSDLWAFYHNSNSASVDEEDDDETSVDYDDFKTDNLIDIFSKSKEDKDICLKDLSDLTKDLKKKTFTVKTENEIINAINHSNSTDIWTEIIIKKWTYNLSNWFWLGWWKIIIRWETWDSDDVKLYWKWMDWRVTHIFWVASSDVIIWDLTVWEVANHPIQIHGEKNADNFLLHNTILVDGWEQLFKWSYNKSTPEINADNWIIQCSEFVYSKWIWPQYYIWWIDIHRGVNWLVQYNSFSWIRSPENRVAEHAVHFWSESEDVVVKNNKIENCDRWIWFWLGSSWFKNGAIINNEIYHDDTWWDVGIWLESASDVLVKWNTIIFENDYKNAIEYRFSWTFDVTITWNKVNRLIKQRDGWKAEVYSNDLSNQ